MVVSTPQYWSTVLALASNSEMRKAGFMVNEEVDHNLCHNALPDMV